MGAGCSTTLSRLPQRPTNLRARPLGSLVAGSLPAGPVSAFTHQCIWGGDATWGSGKDLSREMKERRMEDKVPHAAGRGLLPVPAPAPATVAAGLPLAIWTAVLFLWQHFSRNISEGAWCCVKTREAASPPPLSPAKSSEKRRRHLSCLPPHLPPWRSAPALAQGAAGLVPSASLPPVLPSPAFIFALPSPLALLPFCARPQHLLAAGLGARAGGPAKKRRIERGHQKPLRYRGG